MTPREAIAFVKDKLEFEISRLADVDRLTIDSNVPSIETYSCKHPMGEILLIYRGSDFTDNEAPNFADQKRTLQIAIYLVLKKTALVNMTCEDWIEFCVRTLSGKQCDAWVSYVKNDEWIQETAGEWWYGITVALPSIFINH